MSEGHESDPPEAPPTVRLSANALCSVVAALGHVPTKNPGGRTDAEIAHAEAVKAAVLKPGGHVERADVEDEDEEGIEASTRPRRKLYSVTTIASSARFGGTRTVEICDSFERACETLEGEYGRFYWEHSYALAVIEVFWANRPYGGLGHTRDRYWYRFEPGPDGDYQTSGTYKAIETPPGFEDVGEFAVG